MTRQTPTTEELIALDRRHVWHPFTQMQGWMDDEDVLVIDKAQGFWLEDTGGRRYLDGISSLWCNMHGHRVEAIDQAVREQLDRIAHSTLLGMANTPSIQLAARLAEITPGDLDRVFYSDAGATAVEAALKMAFQYHAQRGDTGRDSFAALSDAYHGDTVGSVSIGGIEVMHSVFDPLRFNVVRLPSPHCYRCPLGLDPDTCGLKCADDAEQILEQHASSLAGLVIEPLVQGAAGIIVHPEGYLARMREVCTRLGILLVADEVAVGFGRTGTMFACEQEAVVPDLLCLAKGISGGYLPLAATVATEEVFSAFLGSYASRKTFFHGHTYTGNPLGCAAGLASMDLLQGLMPELPGRVERLANLLAAEVKPLPHVGQIRQKGLMVGIELVEDVTSRRAYAPALRTGHQVIMAARNAGVIIRPLGDVVVLMPGPSMPDDELELLIKTTAAAVAQVTGS
jgi:adenosylmethionine---8-amino-7-oxononanoate aminotransferase